MIVAIHQPHYVPWLGYLHRMGQADAFIVLDQVQFERRNYQNRTRIRIDDQERWLTVPVIQRSQKERIVDKEIEHRDTARAWGAAHFATLRHAYRDAGYFGSYAGDLRELLFAPWQRLVDLDLAMLALLRSAFDIRTPLLRSSQLAVPGAKSELILNLCKAAGATALLAGFGGSRRYLDVAEFERNGIEVRWHEFVHPVYRQCGAAPFMPGLAALDLLFNAGPRGRAVLFGELEARDASAAA